MANGLFGGGNGTTSAPYLIEDAADFNAIRNKLSVHYRQIKDIDFASFGKIAPIGTGDFPFTGTYEGRGFKLNNIHIESATPNTGINGYQGLFGLISSPAVIQNIHVRNGILLVNASSTRVYIGGILGHSWEGFNLRNCSFHGRITIPSNTTMTVYHMGGIVGGFYGAKDTEVANCDFEGVIENLSTRAGSNAGIIGSASYAGIYVRNCRFKGTYDIADTDSGTLYGITYPSSTGKVEDCIVEDSVLRGRSTVCGMGGVSHTRCKVIRTKIESTLSNAAGIGEDPAAEDCIVEDCEIIAKLTAGGIGGAYTSPSKSVFIHRCIVRNTLIDGGTVGAGMLAFTSSRGGSVQDSAVIGGKVKGKTASAGGVVAGYVTSCIVDRCHCSANVETEGSHVSGISALTLISGNTTGVRDSVYLGEYIKGLGAKTANAGLISAMSHTVNRNNYSLDSAQVILE